MTASFCQAAENPQILREISQDVLLSEAAIGTGMFASHAIRGLRC